MIETGTSHQRKCVDDNEVFMRFLTYLKLLVLEKEKE